MVDFLVDGKGQHILPTSGSPSFFTTNECFFSWSRTATAFGELT
jgi:hypothetical protein